MSLVDTLLVVANAKQALDEVDALAAQKKRDADASEDRAVAKIARGVLDAVVERGEARLAAAVEADEVDAVAPESFEARLYGRGWLLEDLVELKANQVLVEPIMPPKKIRGGLIHLPDKVRALAPNQASAFRVLLVSDRLEDESLLNFAAAAALPVVEGDVVVLRNAMLDPIHPNGFPLLIHRRHILAKVRG